MKKTKIIYRAATALFALMMVGSAIPDILSSDVAVKGMHEGLGYPLYLIPFIGIAKVLGVIAILIPGFPRIKEWAYAGLFFDLAGASYSIYSSGERGANLAFMALPILLGAVSYVYYRKRQRIAETQLNMA
jgi:uncharacterized membrane protein YphA (DoxX/SURF4 family)